MTSNLAVLSRTLDEDLHNWHLKDRMHNLATNSLPRLPRGAFRYWGPNSLRLLRNSLCQDSAQPTSGSIIPTVHDLSQQRQRGHSGTSTITKTAPQTVVSTHDPIGFRPPRGKYEAMSRHSKSRGLHAAGAEPRQEFSVWSGWRTNLAVLVFVLE